MAYDGDYIGQLDPDKPNGQESKSLGDDAIREIKKALTTCFPQSGVGDVYNGTLSQLSDLVAGNTVPYGTVVAWFHSEDAMKNGPEGWTICDGRARADGSPSPDLSGKFIMGARSKYDENGDEVISGDPPYPAFLPIGNNAIVTSTTSAKVQTTNKHTLTKGQIPALDLKIAVATQSAGQTHDTDDWVAGGYSNPASNVNTTVPIKEDYVGAEASHAHNFSINTEGKDPYANVPESRTMIYIVKD